MQIKDLLFSLAASLLIIVFLSPTLANAGVINLLPFPYQYLYGIFPVLTVVGMFVAKWIGKRLPILWQFAKFALVGVLNTAIDFGILNILMSFTQVVAGTGLVLINIVSFSTSIINSYFWNKAWVFGSAKKSHFWTFLVVTLIGLVINTSTVYLLTTYVLPSIVDSASLRPNIAKVFATVLSMVWNFAGYKIIVFRK